MDDTNFLLVCCLCTVRNYYSILSYSNNKETSWLYLGLSKYLSKYTTIYIIVMIEDSNNFIYSKGKLICLVAL